MSTTTNSPSSMESLTDSVSHLLRDLDTYLESQVPHFEPEIQELVHYALQYKGKRLRPLLVFFSGYGSPDPQIQHNLVKVAAILELIHLATLVHDDFLDEAIIRRNNPTLANKFGSKHAVLLGDALFSHALLLSSQFPTTTVCQHVSQSTRLVCSGEILQTLHTKGSTYSLDDYFRVINLKTAELFHVSCFLGSFLANNTPEFNQALSSFGRNLGIAYQIFDDWLDLTATEENIGKTLNTDLSTGKLTLPLFLLIQSLPVHDQSSFTENLLNASFSRDQIYTKIIDNNVFEALLYQFNTYTDRSKTLLLPYQNHPAFPYLSQIQELIEQKMEASNPAL